MFATSLFVCHLAAALASPRMFGVYESKGGSNNFVTQRPKPITYPTKGPIKSVTRDPCIGKEYAPDPKNCNVFFQCAGGKMMRLPCPPGLHWNQREKMCDWPHKVNRPECPASASSQTCNTSPNSAGFVCPKPSGWFADVKGDCSSFYMCDHCKATLKRCPKGLAWNQKLTTCDWPSNVKGCKAESNSQHTQKPLPPVTQRTMKPTQGNIKGGYSGRSSAMWANLWANNNYNWRNAV